MTVSQYQRYDVEDPEVSYRSCNSVGMTKKIPKLSSDGLSPQTTVATLARSTLLDKLDKHELVTFLRLIAAIGEQGQRTVRLRNRELCDVPRTAIRALQRLEASGLIRITYPDGVHVSRTIEVL